jgi:hypothetical protein
METGIQIVWWIGLILALIITLGILKAAFQIINVLRDIYQLSEITLKAASGIKSNLSYVKEMDTLHLPAQNLHMAAASLKSAAEEFEPQSNKLTSKFYRRKA